MRKIEISAGTTIDSAVKEALQWAPVCFDFNDVLVEVSPGEAVETVVARWNRDREAAYERWINSPEYKERERKRAEEWKARCERVLTESAQTEADMRAAKDPDPVTPKQLSEYIESLVTRNHDYGTCVYAMSLAAVAAFNYVAHKLGVTDFQASCADLDILRRTRNMEGPFMLTKAENALYPQYDLIGEIQEAMLKWKPWLAEEAAKRLAERHEHVSSPVLEHWRKLAGSVPANEKPQ